MSNKQRQHEDYWGRYWAVALGKHMDAEVSSTRPEKDPPDVDFRIRRRDGTVTSSWGEITGAYNSGDEAKNLWDSSSKIWFGLYVEPDAVNCDMARKQFEVKRKKYGGLVRQRGQGHLLILLLSPFKGLGLRTKVEECILDLFEREPSPEHDPFETVWLGYRVPSLADPEEMEDQLHLFPDAEDGERHNFLKCIWKGPQA